MSDSNRISGELYRRDIPHYGHLVVLDTVEQGKRLRLLLVDHVRESAMFLDPEKQDQPVFKYMKRMEIILDDRPDIRSTLLIGGAGFVYPRCYLSRYPEKELEVVELMPFMRELAERYFGLAELEQDPRLKINIMEGMRFLQETDGVYDAIFNDAFIADRMDKGIASPEGVAQVKRHLRPGGLYVINLLTGLFGTEAYAAKQFRAYLKQAFEYTLLLRTRDDLNIAERQNFLLLASDESLSEYVVRDKNTPYRNEAI